MPRKSQPCPACGVDKKKLRASIAEVSAELDRFLECDGMTWELEQEASPIQKKLSQVKL